MGKMARKKKQAKYAEKADRTNSSSDESASENSKNDKQQGGQPSGNKQPPKKRTKTNEEETMDLVYTKENNNNNNSSSGPNIPLENEKASAHSLKYTAAHNTPYQTNNNASSSQTPENNKLVDPNNNITKNNVSQHANKSGDTNPQTLLTKMIIKIMLPLPKIVTAKQAFLKMMIKH